MFLNVTVMYIRNMSCLISGVDRLIKHEAYTAAYPLHEVIIKCFMYSAKSFLPHVYLLTDKIVHHSTILFLGYYMS